jgi:hypothetical protein
MRSPRALIIVCTVFGASACQFVLDLTREDAGAATMDAAASDVVDAGAEPIDVDADASSPWCAPASLAPDATDEFVLCGDGSHQLSRDSLNCGECSHACDDKQPCNGGLCAPIASAPLLAGAWGPYVVRVEGDRVSWILGTIESGNDYTLLWESAIDGSGSINRTAISGLPSGYAHGDEGDYTATELLIAFTPRGSNTGVVLGTSDFEGGYIGVGRPALNVSAIAVGGEYVYFWAGANIRSFRRDRPVDAGAGKADIVFDGVAPVAIAADEERLFWAARENGGVTIKASAHGQHSPQLVVPHAEGYVDALATDATHLYWVDVGARTLYRALKTGGGGGEIVGRGPDAQPVETYPSAWLVLDETSIYWTLEGAGTGILNPYTILRTPRCGVTRVLAQDLDPNATTGALGLALDGKDLYYGALATHEIRHIRK